MAGGSTNLIVFLILHFYTNFKCSKLTPNELTEDDKIDLIGFLKLGVPCALMLVLEQAAYSLMNFQSGFFGVESQATQVILYSIGSIIFMVSLGLSSAASTLIGG